MENRPQTARGREEPYAIQFSIFLANRIGQLKDLMGLFAQEKEHVHVLGMSVVDSADWAVIRTVFSDADRARHLLQTHAFPFTESSVLLVELDGPAAISHVCTHLLAAEINIHFAYPLIIQSNDNPVMVFHVDDHLMATQVLASHGLVLLGNEDLDAEGPDADTA